MRHVPTVIFVYGLLVLAGGLLGYAKARSKPSLMAGVCFGLGLLVSGFAAQAGHRQGLHAALVLAALLLVIMGARFARTKKFMPAGLLAALSLAVVVIVALAVFAAG
jgi:uncharacterized membrane protein (UPF0136 family)